MISSTKSSLTITFLKRIEGMAALTSAGQGAILGRCMNMAFLLELASATICYYGVGNFQDAYQPCGIGNLEYLLLQIDIQTVAALLLNDTIIV